MRRALAVLAASIAAAPASAADPPKSNQLVLTARQSQRLVDYSAALGSCLRQGGLAVSRPHATRKQIGLTVHGSSQREVIRASMRCSGRLGDPPSYASLQGFADRIVLYVPKQCLIDEKVARDAG
jgi:hypothetical protein